MLIYRLCMQTCDEFNGGLYGIVTEFLDDTINQGLQSKACLYWMRHSANKTPSKTDIARNKVICLQVQGKGENYSCVQEPFLNISLDHIILDDLQLML